MFQVSLDRLLFFYIQEGIVREESKRPKILLTTSVLFPPAPLKMSETLFENFEKMGKKQNKEQVPPATEPQSKKQSSNKQSKKSQSSNTSTPATHRNLEEAFKSVSNLSSTPCIFLRFYFSVICSFFFTPRGQTQCSIVASSNLSHADATFSLT